MKTLLMVLLCCVFGSAQAGLIKKTLVVGGVVVAGSMAYKAYAAKNKQRANTDFCQDEDYPGDNPAEHLKSAILSQTIRRNASNQPKRNCREVRSLGVIAELYIREVSAEKANLRQVAIEILCLAHDRMYNSSAGKLIDGGLDIVSKKLGLPRSLIDFALKESKLNLELTPDECSGDAPSNPTVNQAREKRVLVTLIDNAINHELIWLGGMCFAGDTGATEVSQRRINETIRNCNTTSQNKGAEIKSVVAWEAKLSNIQK